MYAKRVNKRPYAKTMESNKDDSYICGVCPLLFQSQQALAAHRRLDHRAQYTCLLCRVHEKRGGRVEYHMKIDHDINEVFTCLCCDFTYGDRESLMKHMESLKMNGTPGDVMPIAVAGDSFRQGSVSPSSTTSTSPTSTKSSSPAPEVSENVKLFHDTVERILKLRNFQSDELTLPKTWMDIVAVATSYIKIHHGKEVKLEDLGKAEIPEIIQEETNVKQVE